MKTAPEIYDALRKRLHKFELTITVFQESVTVVDPENRGVLVDITFDGEKNKFILTPITINVIPLNVSGTFPASTNGIERLYDAKTTPEELAVKVETILSGMRYIQEEC